MTPVTINTCALNGLCVIEPDAFVPFASGLVIVCATCKASKATAKAQCMSHKSVARRTAATLKRQQKTVAGGGALPPAKRSKGEQVQAVGVPDRLVQPLLL